MTPEQQQAFKDKLAAMGIYPDKPRHNWMTYIRIGNDYYDVAEVLMALVLNAPVPEAEEEPDDEPAQKSKSKK